MQFIKTIEKDIPNVGKSTGLIKVKYNDDGNVEIDYFYPSESVAMTEGEIETCKDGDHKYFYKTRDTIVVKDVKLLSEEIDNVIDFVTSKIDEELLYKVNKELRNTLVLRGFSVFI